jgi:hypothetical protein
VASNYRPDELGTVVSISEDGQINTAGSGGHRIPAHQARIAARAGDTSPEADDLRKRAANRRALRERQQPAHADLRVPREMRAPVEHAADRGRHDTELARELLL